MIYSKLINEIQWSDVEDFCRQGIKEGAFLDYKQDFPSQLEKTISAMANTFGGIIIIGVEEDKENKPIVPVEGIAFKRGLSERVISIILANLTPPVFPEIQVCTNETGEKALVVIRIPQSHQTPHAISNNTKVYLRTGDINNPEELATIDDVNWLNDHRSKSVDLRETLYQQAEMRYKAFYNRVLTLLTAQGERIQETTSGIFTISTCPTYPHTVYRNPSQLSGIHEKIRIHDYFGTSGFFPPEDRLARGMVTLVQDGVVFVRYTNQAECVLYTAVNSQGLYFFRQSIRQSPASEENPSRDLLSGGEIVARIDEFLDTAENLYRVFGYWGYIDIEISLTKIHESGLFLDWLKSFFYDPLIGFSPDDEVVYTRTVLAGDLMSEKEQILFEAIQKLFWTFNIDFVKSYLDTFNNKNKPH